MLPPSPTVVWAVLLPGRSLLAETARCVDCRQSCSPAGLSGAAAPAGAAWAQAAAALLRRSGERRKTGRLRVSAAASRP